MRFRKPFINAGLIAIIASALALAGVSLASAKGLGDGPALKQLTPIKGKLPKNKALIVVTISKGKVIGLTGTAVPKGKVKKLRLGLPKGSLSARCSTNFTRTKTAGSGKVTVRWFAGIGCNRPMFLFGQAFLQESATTVDASGDRYELTGQSAASGRNATVINKPNPSLYVRHLTNVYFSPPSSSGTISVYPAPGQQWNGASKCVAASEPGHGIGVHCDLYSNRF